jgi:hypothetical protein
MTKHTFPALAIAALAITACSDTSARHLPAWVTTTATPTSLTLTNTDHDNPHAVIVDWATTCTSFGTNDPLDGYSSVLNGPGHWDIEVFLPAGATARITCLSK